MLILTDGVDNASSNVNKNNAVNNSKNNGIVIHTIGIGAEVNNKELLQIARDTGGDYYISSEFLKLEKLWMN